ncbi:MAG TPA: helicase, partial [Cyanobacteria bacterium UBA8803]|nr:helicase [Cyanobacteria bacterium UBA8803]
LYLRDLQQLKLPRMLKRIADKFISPLEREMAEKWSIFFLFKGFLSGLNLFHEYINSTGWHKLPQRRHLEILYYQCKFCGDNSLGTYENKTNLQWFKELLSQFDNLPAAEIERQVKANIDQNSDRGQKGEFVNADTLILLRCRRQFRVFCADLSVFSVRKPEDVKDLNYIEILRDLLIADIRYLKAKSVFSNLRLDIGSLGLDLSADLKTYFTAFKYDDKESAKLIQAASYACSFARFLDETGILGEEASVVFNVVGCSDRSLSAMSVGREHLHILATCYQIYKHDSSPQDIPKARALVLKQIQRNAYRSFEDGKKFVDALLAIPPDHTTLVTHKERVAGFFNSVGQVPPQLMEELGLSGSLNLRQAHAELIKKALVSQATYIFLTGNPGIGKTTAIAEFLKSHLDEGFLFFYVSPRKQVNLDIIEKFKDSETQKLCDSRLFAINTHAGLIKDNFGRYTVQYLCNEYQGDFPVQAVNFLDSRTIERRGRRPNRLTRITEDTIQDVGQKTRGVLNSICEAIYTIVDRQISDRIVATVSIQALKVTETGNTLKHFEKIFKNAYNQRDAVVIPEQMQEISSRIKHLFIMIDEITGDDSGVEFLNGISSILSKYNLTDRRYGFNPKVIVADASIVESEVITQHLSEPTSEPDKIYFRRASAPAQPLSVQPFKFKGLAASVINANSYPARHLGITYKVLVESCQFNEESRLNPQDSLTKNLQEEILKDIETILSQPDVDQVLVYIQNKKRLTELIEKLGKQREAFEKWRDYLEIHANISEDEKEKIQKYKNQVKIVFMTAAGSRGLSFPKAKHILVEIPRFEIEKNLMEVIQVIYRGRGQYQEEGVWQTRDDEDKELVFYLADRSVYYDDSDRDKRQLSVRESVLSLLNILLILKASVMTRIQGVGQIGRHQFLMIPIGGKSISAAGETFTSQMANLIGELKKEHNRNKRDRRLLQVYISLEQLLDRAEFTIRDTTASNYLALRSSFNSQFTQLANSGLDGLLKFGQMEAGYISGGLLIVPIADKGLEETYEMQLIEIATHATEQLWRNMQGISRDRSYPENLRSAIKDALELVKKLREPVNKTQWFEQHSRAFDQYYALPLFTFIAGAAMKDYFASGEEEPEQAQFRDILSTYIRTLYPVGSILPIGHKYQDFPFVVFRSYSLREMREKMFADKYLLRSTELNVLNLILAEDP